MGKLASSNIEIESVELNIVRPSGYSINGTLTFPKGEVREGPIVVFLHGTMSDRNHNFVPELTDKLVKSFGIRSYRFDFRFDKTDEEPNHRYKFSGYNDDINDMEYVISYLQKSGFQPFCLFGHSRGANDALIYASTRLKQTIHVPGLFCGNLDRNYVENGSGVDCAADQKLTITDSSDTLLGLISTEDTVTTTDDTSSMLSHAKYDRSLESLDSFANMAISSPTMTSTPLTTAPLSALSSDRTIPSSTSASNQTISQDSTIDNTTKYEDHSNDTSFLLDASKLVIVVAAPRFFMPRMLTSIFPQDKTCLLEKEGTFEWISEKATTLNRSLFVTQSDANVVLLEMNMQKTVESIPSNIPILLFHGTEDELIPLEDAHSYKESRQSIELQVIEGARHAFRGKKPLKQLLNMSSEFIWKEYQRIYGV